MSPEVDIVQNEVVVVTGSLGALGRAVTRAFETAGARLGTIDHSAVPVAEAARAGDRYFPVGSVDLTRLEQAEAAVQAIVARFGRLDVLVNIAGGFQWQTLEEGSIEAWDQMYAMNLKTAVTACKAALPALLKSGAGRIINIGAGAASSRAAAGMGAYTASKAGVQRLTESLANELKDRGVTVNAVLPGTIDTPRNRADMPKADHSKWVPPEAIADVILFLASPAARAVTGAAVPVFGRG
ncbi:MAG TPA: SDR family NAD(P)-dependent oxidoreductase [Steroidobacteraceae bacterium]|nr:SDR family NAD(P)-dependent oxidoreductase [Steroidobacteraceae bacterium]